MWHSKYKSSPSLISSLDKVEPSWMLTKGGSGGSEKKEKWEQVLERKDWKYSSQHDDGESL